MGKGVGLVFAVLVLVFTLAMFQATAQAACWDCADGSSDSGDNSAYCECDEQEKCKDPFRKSTAWEYSTGWGCGDATSGTDYCQDSNTLKEAYLDCYACDEIKWITINCNNYDGSWTYYQSGSCVKRQKKEALILYVNYYNFF